MYDTGQLTKNGKPKYEFVKTIYTPTFVKTIEIPCGKCIGCEMDKTKEWATRCVLESKLYPKQLCWFITLTYNDEYIPTTNVVDYLRGTLTRRMTLHKKDLQDFLKRLRRAWEYKYNWQGIRYFGCGEYGSTTFRPHYHICIYNLPIPDKEPLSRNFEMSRIWVSKEIEKIWGMGNIVIGQLTYESAAYTARYTLKKQNGLNKALYERLKIEPEFTIMSTHPGIGAGYYQMKKNTIYETDEIFVQNRKGDIIRQKPPNYFDYLYNTEEPEILEEIKAIRLKLAQDQRARERKENTMPEWEYRKMKEEGLKEKIKRKKRGL